MNRIIEDRLLLEECEKIFVSLNNTARKNGIESKVVKNILDKFHKHREKFTRRKLDKELYIRKNKELFDAIYEKDRNRLAGSFFDLSKDLDADKCEDKIYEDLVKQGFYSHRTYRMDVIRSLMKTYRKIFDKE